MHALFCLGLGRVQTPVIPFFFALHDVTFTHPERLCTMFIFPRFSLYMTIDAGFHVKAKPSHMGQKEVWNGDLQKMSAAFSKR